MAAFFCVGSVSTRRGLLASSWTLVTVLTLIAFLLATIFTLSEDGNSNDQQNNYQDGQQENMEPEMAVTSRAMAFTALWTAVLAVLIAIFGTVVLGWQSPTGPYYTCCSTAVHRTTPLALGSFIGALLMFANLTLVCSILFGEFDIRDYEGEDRGRDQDHSRDTAARSSMAFSIMCMFLTVLYAGFAALTFALSRSVLEELADDERSEIQLSSRGQGGHFVVGGYDGYIGERFDVRRSGGFVAPTQPEGTLT